MVHGEIISERCLLSKAKIGVSISVWTNASGGQEEVQSCCLMDGVDGWPAGVLGICFLFHPLDLKHELPYQL